MLLRLCLELFELGHDLRCLLNSVLKVLFPLGQEHVLRDVRQKLNDERVIDKVEELWLNLRSEDLVEFGQIAHKFLITHSQFMLFCPYVLNVARDGPIRLKRLNLSKDCIEPLLEVKMRLSLEDEGPRLVLNLKDEVT